jgi:hypothetical protein
VLFGWRFFVLLYGAQNADGVLTVFSCESIIKGKEYVMTRWIRTRWISQGINDVRGGEWEALDCEEVYGPLPDERYVSDDGSTFYHVITEQEQDDE